VQRRTESGRSGTALSYAPHKELVRRIAYFADGIVNLAALRGQVEAFADAG
jgi:hypothetical protein